MITICCLFNLVMNAALIFTELVNTYTVYCRSVGEAATVDAGARAGGARHRGEGEHQGAGEGHRADRQDDR